MDINVQKGYLITDNKFIVKLDKIIDGYIETEIIDKIGTAILNITIGNDIGRLLKKKDETTIFNKELARTTVEIKMLNYPIHDEEVFHKVIEHLRNCYEEIRNAQYKYLSVFM